MCERRAHGAERLRGQMLCSSSYHRNPVEDSGLEIDDLVAILAELRLIAHGFPRHVVWPIFALG